MRKGYVMDFDQVEKYWEERESADSNAHSPHFVKQKRLKRPEKEI
jgi:hypothetical protein